MKIFMVVVSLFLMSLVVHYCNKAQQVVDKTLDANNVINTYEWFFDNKAAFDSRLAQIKSFKEMIKESKGEEKSKLKMELSAMQQSCRELANKYNGNSQKLNQKIFKDKEQLPSNLDSLACE